MPSLDLGLLASHAWNEGKRKGGMLVGQVEVQRSGGAMYIPTTRVVKSHFFVYERMGQSTIRRCH